MMMKEGERVGMNLRARTRTLDQQAQDRCKKKTSWIEILIDEYLLGYSR